MKKKNRGCQFIIATHSPVLLSYPNAQIFEATASGFINGKYDELESVKNMKRFLNNKEQFFKYLFE